MPYAVFNFNSKDVKNFLDSAERWIALATLNIFDCGKSDLCHFCKILLGKG